MKKYGIKKLDCANCASKLERSISKLSFVEEASINFASSTMFISYKEYTKEREDEIFALIKKLEPQCEVTIKDSIIGTQNVQKTAPTLKPVGEGSKKIKRSNSFAPQSVKLNEKNLKTAKVCDTEDNIELSKDKNELKPEENRGIRRKLKYGAIILGVVLFIVGMFFMDREYVKLGIFLSAYLLIGGEVILKAIRNIFKGKIFDENFLMLVATIGAFVLGEYVEAVAVMLFYQVGEFFQDKAVYKARGAISGLMNIKATYANILENGIERKVDPKDLKLGDTILIKVGEKAPVDGQVIKGNSFLDTSALTGETVPRRIREGEAVLSGYINQTGLLEVRVTSDYNNSTVAKILDIVENASAKKAQTEKFITKFARIYTPTVILIAILIAICPPLIMKLSFNEWVYNGLVFLFISCPCALVISVPLSYFSGIGALSKKGVLVKGSNYLEALSKVGAIVFDKTGTLTKGEFSVTKIIPKGSLSESELLDLVAETERYSNHPIATAILKKSDKNRGEISVSEYKEIGGKGISAVFEGQKIYVGNCKLMAENGIDCEEIKSLGSVVHVASEREYLGYIEVSDSLKEDSFQAILDLKSMGITNIVMMSGDSDVVAMEVANTLDISKVYGGLLPDGKLEKLEEIMARTKGKVVFVGDGINDAPVLARADIGIAMGVIGSDSAIEAADVVIMNDLPSSIAKSIKSAKFTKGIVLQNISFALLVKFVVLILSAFGITTMLIALFADVGVSLLAILNSIRRERGTKKHSVKN